MNYAKETSPNSSLVVNSPNFKNVILSFFALLFGAIGCDTLHGVNSRMDWVSPEKIVDQNCIRKAVENTAGVKFLEQKVESTSWSYPKRTSYKTTYRVLGNFEYDLAFVGIYINESEGGIDVSNSAYAEINSKMGEKDQEGFAKAIKAVNQSLTQTCPFVKNPTEPRKF